MQFKAMKSLLSTFALSILAIGCGKGFDPVKFEDSPLGASGAGGGSPAAVTPVEEVPANQEFELRAKTLRAAQLIKSEDQSLTFMGLVYFNDENAFEISVPVQNLEDGSENMQIVTAAEMTVLPVIISDKPSAVFPVAEMAISCMENCAVVNVILNFGAQGTEKSVELLGNPVVVEMQFKRGPETAYVLDSNAGHRGFDSKAYADARLKLEGEIAARDVITAASNAGAKNPAKKTPDAVQQARDRIADSMARALDLGKTVSDGLTARMESRTKGLLASADKGDVNKPAQTEMTPEEIERAKARGEKSLESVLGINKSISDDLAAARESRLAEQMSSAFSGPNKKDESDEKE